MLLSMYAVVEFVGEESVALAAENWLKDTGTSVMWPPYKSQTRVDRAVLKCEPPTDGYQKFPCRVLYKTSSYEKGLTKVRKAEDISDLASDAECAGIPVKRKSRPNPRYQDSDSSSSGDSPGPSHNIQKGNQQKQQPSAATSTSKTPPRALPSPPSSLISQWPVPVCTATEKKILTVLEEVKMFQAGNRAMLISICRKLDNSAQGNLATTSGLPEEVVLPLKLVKDMRDMETTLNNFEKEKQLVTYLSNIGGDSLKSIVRRILTCVISNDLARQYNWVGKGTKEAFCKLRLVAVIHRAVRRNPSVQSATNAEIDEVIKVWLRYSKDRDGGRAARRAAAAAVAESEASKSPSNLDELSTEEYSSNSDRE